jgi:hypothetical protein
MSSNNPFESKATLGIVRDWDEFSGPDFLKSDIYGNWSQNGAPADSGPYLPLNYRHILQRWQNNRRIDVKDATDFDLGALNRAVSKAEWEPGFNPGELRPPWQRAKQLILMNLRTGEQIIYSATNTRSIIAVTRLIDQVRSKNFMLGRTASPVVELGNAPFNTQFGMQKRGDFKVIGKWLDLSGVDQILPGPSLKALPEPTLAAEFDDEIPAHDKGRPWDDPIDDLIEDKPQAKSTPKQARGRQ